MYISIFSFKLLEVACYHITAYSNSLLGIKYSIWLAGQINLAHGVFVGIGTYVSAIIGGVATSSVIGYELDMIIWLPLSGFGCGFCREY